MTKIQWNLRRVREQIDPKNYSGTHSDFPLSLPPDEWYKTFHSLLVRRLVSLPVVRSYVIGIMRPIEIAAWSDFQKGSVHATHR